MADPFLGEIRMFGFGFAPEYWATCDGQTMQINQNQALYSLLGTMYGGNGTTTFNLPDLRGRTMFHPKSGVYSQGGTGGSESVALVTTHMPAHNHQLMAAGATAQTGTAQGNSLAMPASANAFYAPQGSGGEQVTLGAGSLAIAGSSQGHNNMQPSLVLNFCIAIQGIYPSRN